MTDQRLIRPCAERKSERIDDDGLTRAGFTAENIQLLTENEGAVVDQGNVFNAEASQHNQSR